MVAASPWTYPEEMGSTHPARLLPRIPLSVWRGLDTALGVLYVIPAAMILVNEAASPSGTIAALLAATGCSLTIMIRRSHPAGSLAIQLVIATLIEVVEPRGATAILLPIALVLYTVAAETGLGVAVASLAGSVAVALGTTLPQFSQLGAASAFVTLYVISWTTGYAVGLHRRDLRHQLEYQQRSAEAERDQAELRLARERIRIARELHDIVAHGMSVVTVQAGYGGLILDDDPDTARSVFKTIETTGRSSLVELRELLSLLRREPVEPDGPPLGPTPSLADLPTLVSRMVSVGLMVHVRVRGSPRPLPAGPGLAAYRILQEALTNVVRHAGSATATVVLDYQADALGIVVSDPGCGSGRAATADGHGITGMRERASLYGGSLDAAPLPASGFAVHCSLPLPRIDGRTGDVQTKDAG